MLQRSLPLFLVAVTAPLFAQAPSIAPAASVLFHAGPAPAIAPDTIVVDDGVPQGQGAFIGLFAGAGIGYLASRIELGGDPTCDLSVSPCTSHTGGRSRGERAIFTAVGALAGMFVGSHLARPRAPKPGAPPAITIPVEGHRSGREDTGVKWWQGSLIGLAAGSAFGAGVGEIYSRFHTCGCDDPGLETLAGGVVGGIVGAVVGGSLAQAH